jgi:hypothetical protein
MEQSIKCRFGFHHFEIYDESQVLSCDGKQIVGRVIVNRCKDCGRLHNHYVPTIDINVIKGFEQ